MLLSIRHLAFFKPLFVSFKKKKKTAVGDVRKFAPRAVNGTVKKFETWLKCRAAPPPCRHGSQRGGGVESDPLNSHLKAFKSNICTLNVL